MDGTSSLVFLSSSAAHDRVLINEVHRHFPLRALLRIQWAQPPAAGPKRSRWQALAHPYALCRERFNRHYRESMYGRLKGKILTEIGGEPPLPEGVQVIDIPSWSINREETRTILAGLQPDVLLVSSAPLLKPPVFTLPRLGTLNVHYGIAPFYRGEHTLFWPLRLGDYEHLGLTVHHIDEGVDTGRVLAYGYMALDPEETEARLWVKGVRLAGKMLVEILSELQRTGQLPEGTRQTPGSGRLIRSRDRGYRHDLQYAVAKRLLGRRPPQRAERIERLWGTDAIVTRGPA